MHAVLLQVRKIIDSLPQRSFMKDEDIDRWIEDVWNSEPKRIIWHANRLRGWGGSEIGILVADMRNKEATTIDPLYHTFKSARELMQEKLCITSPSRDEDDNVNDIRRGTVGEPWLIDRLMEQLKETYGEDNVQLDTDTRDAMAGMSVNEKHPWMVGNIDLAVIINGKRLLIDIKWPRSASAEYSARMTPFTYKCQLKQYETVASMLPVPIHFDETVLACFDSDQFQFHLGVIDEDEALLDDIVRAGDMYFNEYLLKGKIPDYNKSKTPMASTESLGAELNAKLQKAHALKVMKRELEAQMDELEADISSDLSAYKFPPEKIKMSGGLGTINGKPKYTYNNDLMVEYAKRYNIDTSELTDKVLQDIHSAMLRDDNVTTNNIVDAVNPEFSFTFPLSRAKKGAIYSQIKQLSSVAGNVVNKAGNGLTSLIMNDSKQDIQEEHNKKVSYSQNKLERVGDTFTKEPQEAVTKKTDPVSNPSANDAKQIDTDEQQASDDNSEDESYENNYFKL